MEREPKQMILSIRRLALFLFPVALLMLLPMYALWRSQEFVALNPGEVIRIQRAARSTVLFGPAFTDCTKRYKLLGARAAAAKVLVLGSSRTMQIRSGLFLPSTSFYNAGGGASRMGHLRQFLAGLSTSEQPEVLIVGLDQWWFNGRTEADPEPSFLRQVKTCSNPLNLVQQSWRALYSDVYSGRVKLGALGSPNAIGLSAQVYKNGFRNDGSYFYGRVTAHPTDPQASGDFQYRETFRRIAAATGRFSPAGSADPNLVLELERFLDEAKARNIHVVALLPPFAPAVNDVMSQSGKYNYISSLYLTLRPIFEKRGFVLVDQTDPHRLGIGGSEFVDGVHASERAHVRMLEDLLNSDRQLGLYTDRAELEKILARSINPLSIVTNRVK